MSILGVLKAVLGLASVLARYVKDKQLIDAGKAAALHATLERSIEDLDVARRARARARQRGLDGMRADPRNRDNGQAGDV